MDKPPSDYSPLGRLGDYGPLGRLGDYGPLGRLGDWSIQQTAGWTRPAVMSQNRTDLELAWHSQPVGKCQPAWFSLCTVTYLLYLSLVPYILYFRYSRCIFNYIIYATSTILTWWSWWPITCRCSVDPGERCLMVLVTTDSQHVLLPLPIWCEMFIILKRNCVCVYVCNGNHFVSIKG